MPPNNPPAASRPASYLPRASALADPAVAATYKKLRRLKQPMRITHCKRPPGSPGRDSYNLKKTLNMTAGSYSGIWNIVKLILMRCPEIDTTKTITQQRPKSLVAPLFPEFDIYACNDYWPLEGFAHLVFKSWRNKYLAYAPDDNDDNDNDDEPAGNDANMGDVEDGQVDAGEMDANYTEGVPSNDANDGWGEGNTNDGWDEGNTDDGHDGWGKDGDMDTDVLFQPPPEYRQDPAGDGNGDDDMDDLAHNMSSICFGSGPEGRSSTLLQSTGHHGMDVESPGSDSISILPPDLATNVRAQTPISRMPTQPAVSPTSLSVTATATSTATSRSTSTATSTATSAPTPQTPMHQPNSRPLVTPQLANRLQQINELPENLRNRHPTMFQRVLAMCPRSTVAVPLANETARSRPKPKMRPPPPTDAELDAMPDPEPELEGDGPALGEGLLSDSDLSPVPEEGKDLGAKSKGRGQGSKKTGQGARGGARGGGCGCGHGRGGRGRGQGSGRGGGRGGGAGGSQSGGQDSDQDEEFDKEINGQGDNQAQGGGSGQGRGGGQAWGQRNASEGSGPGPEMRQQTTPGESTSGGVMAGKQTRSRSKADASASVASTSGSAPSNKGNRKAGN